MEEGTWKDMSAAALPLNLSARVCFGVVSVGIVKFAD